MADRTDVLTQARRVVGVTGDFWQRVETCWRGAECLPSQAPARRHAHAGLFNYVVAWVRL